MKPVHWLMELGVTQEQAVGFNTLIRELVVEADREFGTMACEVNFSEAGDICNIYFRFVDADAAMIHLAMFGEKFIDRFLMSCSVTGITILGFASTDVLSALQQFSPVVFSQKAGFARFAG